jgi:hypothetical protein
MSNVRLTMVSSDCDGVMKGRGGVHLDQRHDSRNVLAHADQALSHKTHELCITGRAR